jgi:hypothetical protein
MKLIDPITRGSRAAAGSSRVSVKGAAEMQTIPAVFDSFEQAERAGSNLYASLSLAENAVSLRNAADARDASAPDPQGFIATLQGLFLPERDHSLYGEALRRGGTLLCAKVDETQAQSARALLDQSGAIDIDARAAAWRDEGWSDAQSGDAQMSKPRGFGGEAPSDTIAPFGMPEIAGDAIA